jgi:hypothetical protein
MGPPAAPATRHWLTAAQAVTPALQASRVCQDSCRVWALAPAALWMLARGARMLARAGRAAS